MTTGKDYSNLFENKQTKKVEKIKEIMVAMWT